MAWPKRWWAQRFQFKQQFHYCTANLVGVFYAQTRTLGRAKFADFSGCFCGSRLLSNLTLLVTASCFFQPKIAGFLFCLPWLDWTSVSREVQCFPRCLYNSILIVFWHCWMRTNVQQIAETYETMNDGEHYTMPCEFRLLWCWTAWVSAWLLGSCCFVTYCETGWYVLIDSKTFDVEVLCGECV